MIHGVTYQHLQTFLFDKTATEKLVIDILECKYLV